MQQADIIIEEIREMIENDDLGKDDLKYIRDVVRDLVRGYIPAQYAAIFKIIKKKDSQFLPN